MKKLLQRIKFQTGLIILFLIIILCSVFGMFLVSSYIYKQKMTETVSASRVDVLQQISSKVSLIQKSMVGLSNLYESSIMNYVLDKDAISASDISMLEANLNSLELTYKNAMNIIDVPFHTVLIGNNGLVFVTGHEYEVYDYASICRKKWYLEIPEAEDEIFWTRTHTETDNGELYVSLARNIYSGKEKRGVLLISVAEKSIHESYANIVNADNNVYIIDQLGRIISENQNSFIGQKYENFDQLQSMDADKNYKIIEKDNEKYLLSKYTDPDFGWAYEEEIPTKDIFLSIHDIQRVVFTVAIIVSMVAFIMVYFLVRMTTQPLMVLSNKLKQVSHGDFDTDFNVSGWSEIIYINNVSNQMVKKISELILNIKREEELKRNAELKNLRMQINPHFMYNTLFSIKCMIALGESEKAENMVGAFISMLREVLDNDEQMVPLREELEIVDQYLIILKYRFGDSFRVVYEIEPEVENCRVLKMILQPIIENCVIHGIEPKSGRGTISIKACQKDEMFILEISDDGVGMTAERLEEITSVLDRSTGEDKTSGNIGYRNVNQRIKVNFGKEYGIILKQNEKEGITTMVVLPKIYQ